MAHRQDDEASGNESLTDTTDGVEDSDETLSLHRRGALKLLGSAAVAATTGALATGSSVAQSTSRPSNTVNLGDEGLSPGDDISDYLDEYFVEGNEVRVPAGEYEWDGDSGSRTFDGSAWLVGEGEVVLDIGDGSRTNFEVFLEADAHVRIQNVTQRGIVGGSSRFKVANRDENGLIEYINVNRPDGTEGDIDESDSIGFYVTNQHAGVVRFINCHVEGHTNNGIYASSPGEGDSNDGFGPIEVYGGLYKNNDVNNIRPGTPNSKIVGVTCVFDGPGRGQDGGSHKNIRIRESGEDMVIRDCDLTTLDESGAASPIQVDNNRFEGPGEGSAVVEDCRIYNETGFETIQVKEEGEYDISGSNIQLTGGGNYELEGGPYENVATGSDATEPTREERVYDWQGNTDGTDQPSTSPTPSYDHTLRVETFSDPRSGIDYTFTTAGGVAQVDYESNDTITENDDGTYTATGTTGGGFADEWEFNGDLQVWSAQTNPDEDSGEYTLLVDGEEIDPETVGDDDSEPLPNRITFDASSNRSGSYTFEVSGDLEADPDTAPLETADTISTTTATGEVADDADSYRFSGDLVDFDLTGTASVDIEVAE